MNKEKLTEYKRLKAKLSRIKQEEMTLRVDIMADLEKDHLLVIGLNKLQVDGLQLKITRKTITSIDPELLELVFDDLNPMERESISYKPSIVKKVYECLPESSQLHDCVTVKPAAPTIEVL